MIFGRKRRPANQKRGRHAAPEPGDLDYVEPAATTGEYEADEAEATEAAVTTGPFDIADEPDDAVARMDLGSIRLPIPDGAQVQVEMDPEIGGVRAVHVVTEQGQVTISAYAAPRSGELWSEIVDDLIVQLKNENAKITKGTGEWGVELSALLNDVALRFIGVDGPRWMLRGVIAGPQSQAARAPETLRELMRNTIVDRGPDPHPVRTPLPITLPEAVAEHIASQQGG